ncbi:hypothetical protein COOONC_09286 [Cooperia oncophora]
MLASREINDTGNETNALWRLRSTFDEVLVYKNSFLIRFPFLEKVVHVEVGSQVLDACATHNFLTIITEEHIYIVRKDQIENADQLDTMMVPYDADSQSMNEALHRGELGNGLIPRVCELTWIEALEGVKVVDIVAAGWQHSGGMTDDGDVYLLVVANHREASADEKDPVEYYPSPLEIDIRIVRIEMRDHLTALWTAEDHKRRGFQFAALCPPRSFQGRD